MKEFVKSLLTNRLGIVLAAWNVSYFFYQVNYTTPLTTKLAEKFFICLNLPAIIASILPSEFLGFLIFNSSQVFRFQIRYFSFIIFMIFQWVFIAHLAKVIAQRLSEK